MRFLLQVKKVLEAELTQEMRIMERWAKRILTRRQKGVPGKKVLIKRRAVKVKIGIEGGDTEVEAMMEREEVGAKTERAGETGRVTDMNIQKRKAEKEERNEVGQMTGVGKEGGKEVDRMTEIGEEGRREVGQMTKIGEEGRKEVGRMTEVGEEGRKEVGQGRNRKTLGGKTEAGAERVMVKGIGSGV